MQKRSSKITTHSISPINRISREVAQQKLDDVNAAHDLIDELVERQQRGELSLLARLTEQHVLLAEVDRTLSLIVSSGHEVKRSVKSRRYTLR